MFACIHALDLAADLSLPEFAYGFSPVVEEAGGRTVVIDVEGCELLFGSAYQLVTDVSRRAREPRANGGLESSVNVAIAANPDVAIHAATIEVRRARCIARDCRSEPALLNPRDEVLTLQLALAECD